MSLFERPLLGDEFSPKKNAPLFFMPLTVVAVGLAVCGIVANFVVLVHETEASRATAIFKARVMKVFGCLFCVLMIIAEIEWKQFLDTCAILRNWIARGFFYFFVGSLVLEADHTEWYYSFTYYTAFLITGVAGLYFLMGLMRLVLVGKG